MSISEYQLFAAVGIILGDGSLHQGGQGTVLSFSQTTKHTLYFLYVFSLFFDLIGTFPYFMSRFDPRYQAYYYNWQFSTLQFPCLNVLYTLFYDELG
jgi:LAGLIDADG DNA endonuclease family